MSEIIKNTEGSPAERSLYLAFELGHSEWKLGFSIGLGQAARQRKVQAGDLVGLEAEIRRAKERFKVAETTRVVSCYEAGRDGFWLHRYLVSQGVDNRVVDSASIEVNRRAKRAKTDSLDVQKLLTMLIRSDHGEEKVWSVVHVPSVEAEDSRHLHRQLSAFKADRTRHSNRIKGMLVGQGVRLPVEADFLERIEQVRLWDGGALLPGLQARLKREFAGYQFVTQQVQELEAERRQLLRHSTEPSVEQVRRLLQLRGVGENSAWLFVMEFFGWREFRTRRQVGGLAGLTPTPYQSSEQSREQGIDKAGNSPIRSMAIEIAWGWLRHQPDSDLSRWFQKRFGQGSKRLRKIGIVALARKLLIALWRYLAYGEMPAGAQLKPA
jgi:transposase